MAITDAVIPVAGLGTRLLPATRSQPKEMLPILGTPVVQHVVEELAAAGVRRVLFVTGRRKRAIEDHFDADPELGTGPLLDGVEILYTRQARPAGLGDAVRHGASFAGERAVIVALGDTLVTPSVLPRMIRVFDGGGLDAVIAVQTVPDELVGRYGIVVADRDGEVRDVLEKPSPEQTDSRLAIAARYVLGPRVFAALEDAPADGSGEIELATAFRAVLASGGRITAVALEAEERRHDIGTLESYSRAFVEHALADPGIGPALRRELGL